MPEDSSSQPYLMFRDPDGDMTRVALESLPQTMELAEDDVVVVFSEGVTEANNPAEEEYGEEGSLWWSWRSVTRAPPPWAKPCSTVSRLSAPAPRSTTTSR
jgi:hypothetical protein